MNFNTEQFQRLEKELSKARENLIVVEGKKDKLALQQLSFTNIFVINETGKSLYEKIEEIEALARKEKNIKRKIKVCILTDFDRKGRKLYMMLKSELSKRGIKLDNTLRDILLRMHVSHIEGLNTFIENQK